jgi:hypothetical protein
MNKPMSESGRLCPIVVKVWAGKESHDFKYISRSLPSLFQSELPDEAQVILINDCSLDPRIPGFLTRCAREYRNVEIWENPRRMGPNLGQEYNFPLVVERFPDAPFCVLCDDDIIYQPGWLQRLIAVYQEATSMGQRGVFAALNIPFRPHYRSVRLPTSEVLFKDRQPALNWLLPREVYELVGPFRDVGVAYDTDYTSRLMALNIPVICLKPSYVQNIGYHGAYQSDDSLRSQDYVGNIGAVLWMRDVYYQVRRRLRSAADRFPEGRLKQWGRLLYHRLRSVALTQRSAA